MTLTPLQVEAIRIRLTATCTHVEVRPWKPTGQTIEVSQFCRSRLIETVKIGPLGIVTVLACPTATGSSRRSTTASGTRTSSSTSSAMIVHSRISDLRRRGHTIEHRREGDLYQYRLVGRLDDARTEPHASPAVEASAPRPRAAATAVAPEGPSVPRIVEPVVQLGLFNPVAA